MNKSTPNLKLFLKKKFLIVIFGGSLLLKTVSPAWINKMECSDDESMLLYAILPGDVKKL